MDISLFVYVILWTVPLLTTREEQSLTFNFLKVKYVFENTFNKNLFQRVSYTKSSDSGSYENKAASLLLLLHHLLCTVTR